MHLPDLLLELCTLPVGGLLHQYHGSCLILRCFHLHFSRLQLPLPLLELHRVRLSCALGLLRQHRDL